MGWLPIIERVDGVADVVLEDGPMGMFVKVDDFKAASVLNVFACGDAARAAGNATLAVADGAMAGFGANRASMF